MTLLAPWYLLAGVLAAAAVAALHLIAFDRPRMLLLPTARFAPAGAATARTRARRPTDIPLLVLRVLALLLAALAFARPVRVTDRAPLARVVVVDVSASVASGGEARDSVRALLRAGDVLLAMGDTVRAIEPEAFLASVPALGRRPGALTAGVIAALARLRDAARVADSAELVLVSPLAREEVDAATAGALQAWGGRVRVVHVAAAPTPAAATPHRITVAAPPETDDAIAAAAALVGAQAAAETRIVRTPALTAADSAWASRAAGRVLVAWPRAPFGVGGDTARAVRGLAWGGDAAVLPLAAVALVPASDAHVVARWEDGAAAVVERPLGAACVREVGVRVDDRGDVALRAGMLRFVRALGAPCGEARDLAAVPPSALGVNPVAPARVLDRTVHEDPWRLGRWLLGAALLLLIAEPLLRGRGDRASTSIASATRAEAA